MWEMFVVHVLCYRQIARLGKEAITIALGIFHFIVI